MGLVELGPEDIDANISPLYGAIKRTWISFCATTSIHGLKYTRDEETNRIIKFIWLLITIFMFICAIMMVFTFYVDYRSNPTRMNVENDHDPISNLHFPGITICPEILYNLQKSYDYIQTLRIPEKATASDVLSEIVISFGFINDDMRFEPEEIDLMQNVLVLNNLTLVEFLEHLRWSCNDLLYRCRFLGRIVDCSELFQVSRAFFGHCCSFNLNQTGVNFTNRYATHYGLNGGLSIILNYGENDLDQWRSYSRGFKLLLHENSVFPSAHANAKYLPMNEEVFIAVRPVETFCSSAVKALPIDERQCVFPQEFPLKYMTAYVGANCELNCRASNMVNICGCLSYFFYDIRTAALKERICTYADIPCLVENFADIIGRMRNTQCPCPNSCEMVDYDVQLSSAKLQLNAATMDEFYNDIRENFTVAHIFMNSQVYRRVKHDLLSNTVSLVSNLGSAFSLFVGMSMVSAVEIIYYFTVILRKFYVQEVNARKILVSTKGAQVEELEFGKDKETLK